MLWSAKPRQERQSANYTLRVAEEFPSTTLHSAQPRWSHRDPVEGDNLFLPDSLEHSAWAAATRTAHNRLQEMDDRIATTAEVTLDPTVYRAQLFDLAVGRFGIWTERGLAVVSTQDSWHEYERWLEQYVGNWARYVTETCPRVEGIEDLTERLRTLAEQRLLQARRRVTL